MTHQRFTLTLTAILVSCIASFASATNPWADNVVSYSAGSNPPLGYTTSTASLGAPTRDSIAYGGYPITPFQSAADVSELVSLGEGGELVVSFDEPVVDDPNNPFGIDLLIFGNSFFNLSSYNNDGTDLATGATASEGGEIYVSDDGINFVQVLGLEADGAFPTLGYTDVTIPFPASGTVSSPTNFTKPVDPSLDVTGLNTADVMAAYDGSGGGAGIDLATVGLAQISYVKIINPVGSGVTPEIDAFADVTAIPEPTSLLLAAISSMFLAKKRK